MKLLKPTANLLFLLCLLSCSVSAQELKLHNSLLATSSSYTIPANEVWKVMGDFGGGMPAVSAPLDSLALVRKYSGRGLSMDQIKPLNLKGGMVMRETLPVWLAPGSKFSIDPENLMELFLEKYEILSLPDAKPKTGDGE